MARPKFKIDYAMVEKLAGIQCTQQEIASFLGCSVDTLQRDETFCGIYKKGMENGKMSLRRIQYKLAEKNPTMAIWLGKQYLGQKDTINNTNTGTQRIQIINDLGDLDEDKS
jgi:hypothetical protein